MEQLASILFVLRGLADSIAPYWSFSGLPLLEQLSYPRLHKLVSPLLIYLLLFLIITRNVTAAHRLII